ncbi:MAG: 3-phosphoshikimate 1-carboxyvinyltransferase [Thermodesulfobacteriota bacterium]
MAETPRLRIRSSGSLRGIVELSGDKSISHRALLIAALAEGESRVENCLVAGVTEAMIDCLQDLGIQIELEASPSLSGGSGRVIVQGRGFRGLSRPNRPLDCRGSATTMRLLAGVLAAQPFPSTLDGNDRLRERPMGRVIKPLIAKGAVISSREDRAPLRFQPGSLRPSSHRLTVASAQVKSALLLAGLLSKGPTAVSEPHTSRDHTERLLRWLGAEIEQRVEPDGRHVVFLHDGVSVLPSFDLKLPADPSSAAFLLVAGTLVPDSRIDLPGVCINPGRVGLVDVLTRMGASVRVEPVKESTEWEPVADLQAQTSELKGITIEGAQVTSMIDEFPIFAVAATQASGLTVVKDAAELRVKESDRIQALCEELGKLGAQIEPQEDGFVVQGPTRLKGNLVNGRGDHRLAMSLAIAGLVAEGETVVEGWEVIEDSFPGFPATLKRLGADVSW